MLNKDSPLLNTKVTTLAFSEAKNRNNEPYLSIKQHENEKGQKYVFSERAGKNSVAFMLYNSKTPSTPFGLRNGLQAAHGLYFRTCYTGSMDNPDKAAIDIMLEEVKEEAGYIIEPSNVLVSKTYLASTQDNELVFSYLVDVTDAKLYNTPNTDAFDEDAHTIWLSQAEVMDCFDAKAISLVGTFYKNKLDVLLNTATKNRNNPYA